MRRTLTLAAVLLAACRQDSTIRAEVIVKGDDDTGSASGGGSGSDTGFDSGSGGDEGGGEGGGEEGGGEEGGGDDGGADRTDADGDGFRTDEGDCDDQDPRIYPGAPEGCDAVDNDCDGGVPVPLWVPGEHATVQAGIDAAVDGDVVCVEAGTWSERIDYSGKAIEVAGADGPAATTLDGGGTGPVVTIATAETDAVLHGFTVTGGDATNAAGIYIEGANAVLQDVIATGNTCSASWCRGGGLYAKDATVDLRFVALSTNRVTAGNGCYGAGGWVSGTTLSARDLAVHDNTCTGDLYAYGAGLDLRNGTIAEIVRVDVRGNVARASTEVAGAALYIYENAAEVDVFNGIIAGNEADGGVAHAGGVFANRGSVVTLENCTMHGNTAAAQVTSAGVGVWEGGRLTLTSTAVTGNTGGPGVTMDPLGTLRVSYGDVYDNTSAYDGLTDPTGSDGNIAVDPLWTDASGRDPHAWQLTPGAGSPLVDAGDPTSADFDGSATDIGATGGPDAR